MGGSGLLGHVRLLMISAVAALAVFALGATGAQAKTVKLTGQTTVTPSTQATGFLAAKGVTVAPVAPATASNGALGFPVLAGFGNTRNYTGILVHGGGLKFSTANRSAVLTGLVAVRSRRGAVLLAKLPGARGGCASVKQAVRRFAVKHPVIRRQAGRKVRRFVRKHPQAAARAVTALRNYCSDGRVVVLARLRNLGKSVTGDTATLTADLRLSQQAARLLNGRFGTTLSGGVLLGSAVSKVTPAK